VGVLVLCITAVSVEEEVLIGGLVTTRQPHLTVFRDIEAL
jgi:hypothetical protein